MNNILNTSLITAALLLTGHTAMATNTVNVQVKANVVGTCQFVGANDIMIDFGTLDAASGDQSKSAKTQFWCTNGVTYTVSGDDGQNALASQKRMKSGTNYLPYSLDFNAKSGAGAGKATPIDLNVTAEIKGTDLEAAVIADNYLDIVKLTVNP